MNTLNNEIEKQFYPVHTAWNETDKVYSMQLDKPSKAMTNWITIIDDPSDPESFLKLDPKDIDFPITVKNEDLNLCAELFLGRCEFLIRSGGLKTDLGEIRRDIEYGVKKYKRAL